MHRVLILLVAVVFAGCSHPDVSPETSMTATATPSRFRIVGYFSEGDVRHGYTVAKIPADRLDVVIYAFADPAPDGNLRWIEADVASQSIPLLQALKRNNPALRTMLAIGGWTRSGHFSNIARDPVLRTRFCQNASKLAVEHGFDGIDLDWEFPVSGGLKTNENAPEDRHNLTLLVEGLRRTIDARGKGHLLSVVVPGTANTLKNFELAQLTPYVDWFGLMAYDFHGAWDHRTGHHAPLYRSKFDTFPNAATRNVNASVQEVLHEGVPAHKIVLGVPFYGRAWRGVHPKHHGLFQPADGPSVGSYERGVFAYSDILRFPPETYLPHFDSSAQAPYMYAPTVENGLFITYDNPRSIAEKTTYARQRGLGGVLCWALSNDPGATLIDATRAP